MPFAAAPLYPQCKGLTSLFYLHPPKQGDEDILAAGLSEEGSWGRRLYFSP